MSTPPPPPGPSNRVALGGKEYSVELNDANFEAASWKNPRYDGSRTKTTTLNKYNDNDVTFGKTAATQKYTRNIYFGNAVIGLNDTPEDPRLLRIENFSYIQTNRFFTINDDDSISVQRLETTKDNFDSKNGFYRAFYEDFPLESDCRVIVSDDSVKTSLNDKYNIYFNGGVLKKLFSFKQLGSSTTSNLVNISGRPALQIDTQAVKYGTLIKFYNENDIRKFYTGSLETVDTGLLAAYNASTLAEEYFDPFFTFKTNADYKGDKRMFLSFCTQSNSGSLVPGNDLEAIRTINDKNMPVGELFNTENLAELSTTEVLDIDFSSFTFSFADQDGGFETGLGSRQRYFYNRRFPFNFTYNPGNTTPEAVFRCHTLLTLCDDTVPSLLLNLPKEEHLPDGIGRKGFVIVPENIHPHIKQNLVHYLAKAGISLGTDVVPALDNTYRKLM